MRGWIMAAALMVATPAHAQVPGESLDGTWAFQTEPYGGQGFSVAMSGVAVITLAAPDRYDVRLIANELIVQNSTGRSQLVTARESCSGENAGGQFSITCRMAEPLEGYEPDSFVLQRGEDNDQLDGVLAANVNSQVRFTRMR